MHDNGRYDNKTKLRSILAQNYDKGDTEIALLYGRFMRDLLIEKQDKPEMLRVLDKLSRISFKGYEGEYYYILSGYYGLQKSPLFDEDKRDYYLILSYKNGSQAAEKLLKGMGILPELPSTK
ncbi:MULTISPECIES: hypothetical protein [unclassified Pseudoalteromonas]|uniref:hypothetical protein n=1 Tax=unclassified Pseudoalteromonas TaxID=194690 RepID=UPI002097A41E|nr:hypothetical protein [Pseudoalteromonas sp. XMcav2-N]MCO7187422.1 hypothetical protein [Pseudoalteromonas sp. XMcav2-N]